MTENEAIIAACLFLKQQEPGRVDWNKILTDFVTRESTQAMLEREFPDVPTDVKTRMIESARRPYWSISFPMILPDGLEMFPDIIVIKVYPDTAECEFGL